MTNYNRFLCVVLGPISFLLSYYLFPLEWFGSYSANGAVGTVIWMSIWWITCPVDLAVTAFVPIAVNSIFQIVDMNAVISNYSSETILLLLGASILTVSWEETGLDKRVAASLLSIVGGNLRIQISLWFVLSCVMSSILPNAVVCATIIPIAVAMLKYVGVNDIASSKNASLILLTIVYAAGVGGLATPLGGAMNLITVKYIEELTGTEYMYIDWVRKYLPCMVFLVISNALFLVLCCSPKDKIGGSKEYFVMQYKRLPKITLEEKLVLALFCFATILSFTRQFYSSYLPGLKPAYSFIICAIVSFFITHKGGSRLLVWKRTQQKIVWELMYVFAGGLAVGCMINQSGAASSLGKHIALLGATGGFLTVFFILLFTILLSDVTSNTATAAVAVPIVIAVAKGMGQDPIPYVYIATIGVNLSYILPTSIRSIPIGYGMKPAFMIKKGIPITLMMIMSLSVICYLMYL